MTNKDLLSPLSFLGGTTLSGLSGYLNNHAERKDQNRISFLLDKVRVKTTVEDIAKRISEDSAVNWGRVQNDVKRELLAMAAEETGIPLSAIGFPELKRPLRCLNGRNLIGMYGYYGAHPERQGKDTIPFLLEKIGLQISAEDVLTRLKMNRPVPWRRVSWNEIGKVMSFVAQELGVPVSMLSENDLNRTSFAALSGRSLGGLYQYAANHRLRNGKGVPLFLFENAGIVATADDVIQSMKLHRRVMWERVSWDEIKNILHFATEENGLPDDMIGYSQLTNPLNFINNHTLVGFYTYALKLTEKETNETGIDFIRRKFGFPKLNEDINIKGIFTRGSRAKFRMAQMQETFTRTVPSNIKSYNIENLLPWIISVSRLYENFFLGIGREEIQSEVVVTLLELFKEDQEDITKLMTEVHRRLEQFTRGAWSKIYQQRSIDVPIKDNLRLEGILGEKDKYLEDTEDELDNNMRQRLLTLNLLQRKIVYAVTVKGMEFVEVGIVLGLDSEVIEDHYKDALLLLRESMQVSKNSVTKNSGVDKA